MILDYLNTISLEKFQPSHNFDIVTERPVYASVDWLRSTNPKINEFHAFIQKFMPLLRGVGFNFHDSGRGMNGYTNMWQIQYYGDVVGNICADALDKMGGQFELTGQGCQILQVRWDVWCLLNAGLQQYGFRTKRLDVCMDLKGSVWDKFGVNMLDVHSMVVAGDFRIGSGSGVSPRINFNGSWSEIVDKRMGPDDYNPKSHCLDGLTIDIGSRQSVNTWCIYEKGKQLAGKNPDRYDGSLSSWVRFERRYSSGSGRGKVEIPIEYAVYPDRALTYNCAGVESFVGKWLAFQASEGVDLAPVSTEELDLNRVGLLQGLNIKKTALHVARQSARFFKTLEVIGVDVLDFVNLVKHKECNKGFSPEVYESYSVSAGDDIMSFLKGEFA